MAFDFLMHQEEGTRLENCQPSLIPWSAKKKYNRKIDVTFLFLIRSYSYLEVFTRMIFVSLDTFFRSLVCRGTPRERFDCYGQLFIFIDFTCARQTHPRISLPMSDFSISGRTFQILFDSVSFGDNPYSTELIIIISHECLENLIINQVHLEQNILENILQHHYR